MKKLTVMMLGLLALGMARIPANTLPTDWVYKYRFVQDMTPSLLIDTLVSFKFGNPMAIGERMYQPFIFIERNETIALMRKEGGKTWFLNEERYFEPHFGSVYVNNENFVPLNTECLVYDFDANPGDQTQGTGWMLEYVWKHEGGIVNYTVTGADSVYVHGRIFRRQHVSFMSIVEDVGGMESFFPFTFTTCITSQSSLHMVDYDTGIYDLNGNLIFGPNDFETPTATVVKEITEEIGESSDGKMYDLNGREIRTPLPGTVYIRDGRKAVAK